MGSPVTVPAQTSGLRGWVLLRQLLFAVLLLVSASCSEDDGDGPTGPPAVPRIAGIWRGLFVSDNGQSTTLFDLVQSGANISGTVSVGGVVWPLEGEVNTQGFFRWRTGSGTCGSFHGDADLTSATHLSGDAELDRFFCPEKQRLQGDLEMNLETPR